MSDTDKLTDDEQQKIANAIDDVMEKSMGVTTRLDVSDVPEGRVSGWDLSRQSGQGYYAPKGDVDLYAPTGPTSALEDLGLLPHEIESVNDEQQSRSIAAMRLRRLFSETYKRAKLPTPETLRPQPRGLLARLGGMLRLSR